MNERIKGKVRTWKEQGYGFLGADGQRDIFVHFTSVENMPEGESSLEPGTDVEFEIVPGKKEGQMQAANVVIL